MTALIADDSKIMREILKEILASKGFLTIYEALNGEEAVDMYEKYTPDITTLDITMDKCDGLKALQKIRGINQDAKVLMISALGQDVIVKDAIKKGAGGYIVKPFTHEQIITALEKLILLN